MMICSSRHIGHILAYIIRLTSFVTVGKLEISPLTLLKMNQQQCLSGIRTASLLVVRMPTLCPLTIFLQLVQLYYHVDVEAFPAH
jgi:hypothetical protein